MKRTLFVLSIIAFASGAWAQSAKVVSAFNYLKDGDFDQAKTAINEAIQDPKTGVQPKTWYYRGAIYEAIYGDTNFRKKSPEALTEAIKSYQKAMELDPKNQWKAEIQQGLNDCAGYAFNEGVAPYNNKEYETAYKRFTEAASTYEYLNTTFKQGIADTFATLYAAHSATRLKKYDEAQQLYEGLLAKNISKPELYQNLALVYLGKGDSAKAKEVVGKGVKAFPDDKGLMVQQLNMYLSSGNPQASIEQLKEAITKDPNFTALYVQLGNQYEIIHDTANSRIAYEQAIQRDPANFDAYYRMGALYYNQAVDMNNQMNKLDLKEQKKYDQFKVTRDQLFKKALPFLEKAHQYDPKDMDTLIALKELYARLNMMDKLEDTKKQIDALKG